MSKIPIVLIHGYGDEGKSFDAWRDRLASEGYDATSIHLASYVTLNNEVTIKDIAEGLDRALRIRAGLGNDQAFDAIVHSTGMLVIRAWLTTFPGRLKRLKRLIGLAPATFGSPLAEKGRSWIGAVFKGNRHLGPDFMAAGDRVLSALELGSRYTWELAHVDLVADQAVYGSGADTPYPFIFVGLSGYDGIRAIANEPGTDGTVRWSGVGFDARKITLNLTEDPSPANSDPRVTDPEGEPRFDIKQWKNEDVPLVFLRGLNHGTILQEPTDDLVSMVTEALKVEDATQYAAVSRQFLSRNEANLVAAGAEQWQQFIVRAVDQRGDPISDFFVELFVPTQASVVGEGIHEFAMDVHSYQDDTSFRCFHVNLTKLNPSQYAQVRLRIIASSGTALIGYYGVGSERIDPRGDETADPGKWDGAYDVAINPGDPKNAFFRPFTTTLIEIRMNREPLPLSKEAMNLVTKFL